MPAPTKISSSIILPDGKSNEFYMDAFLGNFGATRTRDVIYKDIMGEPLIIGMDLFKERFTGNIKVKKLDRHLYMNLLAQAIINPDEVWWMWNYLVKTKTWSLRRKYFKRWDMDGVPEVGMSSFEFGRSGWIGNTVFRNDTKPHKRSNYIKNQREQLLLYRRKD